MKPLVYHDLAGRTLPLRPAPKAHPACLHLERARLLDERLDAYRKSIDAPTARTNPEY